MRNTGFGLRSGRRKTAGTSSSTCMRAQQRGHVVGWEPAASDVDDPQFGHA
jgi:hypothetical protein